MKKKGNVGDVEPRATGNGCVKVCMENTETEMQQHQVENILATGRAVRKEGNYS